MPAQVIREERRLARDKAAYQRIKQAYAASGGAAAGRRAAAAASSSQPWSAMVEIGPGSGGAAARHSNAAGVWVLLFVSDIWFPVWSVWVLLKQLGWAQEASLPAVITCMYVWADTWLALGRCTVNPTVTFAFYPPTHTDHDACMTVCIHSGAVAAAARELRPVELVGIYEGQKEALEKELAAAKAEVRQGLQHTRQCHCVSLSASHLCAHHAQTVHERVQMYVAA